MCDRNSKKIIELINKPGNNLCADCRAEAPEYGSSNLGVFLCTTCATFHQKIGTHVSKVKSLKLAKWSDDQVQSMEAIGNIEANKRHEKHIPIFYRIPSANDPSVLLEQWIRAKYERLEFLHVDKQKYNKGSLEDALLVKRKKDDNSYAPKTFVLSEDSDSLTILKEDSREPKLVISLARLNISLAPTKCNMENCMQLTFIDEGITKHIFVAHAKGETLIDWYMSIRRAKLLALMRAYPTAKDIELLPYLTKDFSMEGWASKTGPNQNDSYRKRWFTLDNRKLMYHLHPLDDCPRGEIFLGHKSENFSVKKGAITNAKDQGYVFSLVCPDRTYAFSVATSTEREQWISVLEKILDTPIGPQDIQCKVLLDPSKKRSSRTSWFHF